MSRPNPPAYLEELARFACGTRLEDLPPRTLERARWVIADSLPVIAAVMMEGPTATEARTMAARAVARSTGRSRW